MLRQLFNGHILTPQGWINGGSLVMEDGRITEVKKDSLLIEGAEYVDAKGAHVMPGGIEMHCHGGGGSDFMECTRSAFVNAAHTHLKHGTTTMFATLSSSTFAMMEAACKTCTTLIEEGNTTVAGIHFEGPYFNLKKAGAQMPEIIRNPDPKEYHHLIENYKCVRRWSVAPELPGAIEMGRYLAENGVVAAIGHTAAGYEDVSAGYANGYTLATHFYNAMTGFHNVREFKHAGTVESVYLMENMDVEVIADGIHVPIPILRLVVQCKGVERTALITDALAVTACENAKAFDPRVIIEDGVCKLNDRSALAGSIATMDRLFRTMHLMAGIPLADVSRMASETPARIMGILDHKGTLEKGKDADLILMDADLKLQAVYTMGKLVK